MSNRFKEQGFAEELLTVIVIIGIIFGLSWMIGCVKFASSEENVSGIVYNTTNDNWPSGNTYFDVRASVDTYTNSSNKSSYCLPPNSQYKKLVNEAAADKSIKVVVTTKKFFKITGNPLVCVDNVVVTKAK